ncbi:MAG: ABC transporter ATP-binding protein/permease [Treponema sp.]|jgi:ATP-binding cassette subfamily B protein|nr:ABC transporter ATP-binding protein/permease [Treponema sp.]
MKKHVTSAMSAGAADAGTPVRKTGMARLWELALREKALVLGACTLSVISSAAAFVPFIVVYYLIRELAAYFADPANLNAAYMTRLGWIAFAGAGGAIVLYFAALMCSHLAAFKTLYLLKLDFTRHIAALPLGFHTENASGKLRKMTDENIEKLEGFIAHQLPDIAGSFAMPVITLVILAVFDWRLGLASLVPILLSYLVQIIAFGGKSARDFMNKYQTSLEEMNNAAVEYVRGIPVVKAFNQTIYGFRSFHKTIKAYGAYCLGYTKEFETPFEVFMLIINNVYLFLLPVIVLLSGGARDYGEFAFAAVFYLIFSLSLPTSFVKLMYVSQNGRMILDGIERVDATLDTPPLPEAASPKTCSTYSISFENVSFSYKGAAEAALSNVSFTAKQGEITALVGPSGGGKSTLAHLILRFYEVSGGAVKIGGVDIREMASEYLMSIVSFVFQDVFLFKQSVLDNILIGNKNATRQEAVAAAHAAQCGEFVQALPQGYDTVIGAKNVNLSGGERQRLVIARAILKNAPIIVLDEATAFTDPENERKIRLALERLIKDKTVIIIAHRLLTVRGAGKIVVIDQGRVVEEGRHDDLLSAGGRYSRMWDRYAGASERGIGGEAVPKENAHV